MHTELQQLQNYTIREASKLTGLPSSTLRYYETIGIVKPIERGKTSGHRTYSQSDIDLLDTVSCLNATGMNIEDMRTYISNVADGVDHADEQIALLESQKKRLSVDALQLELRQHYVDLKIQYWEAVKDNDETRRRNIVVRAKKLAADLKKIT